MVFLFYFFKFLPFKDVYQQIQSDNFNISE